MRQVLVYRDPESDGWVAEVPSLPGCVSQGQTRDEALDEALANVRQAIDAWVEAAESQGRPRCAAT